jgi:hypothetical protein
MLFFGNFQCGDSLSGNFCIQLHLRKYIQSCETKTLPKKKEIFVSFDSFLMVASAKSKLENVPLISK